MSLNKIEDRWGRVPLEVFNDGRMIAKVIAWRDSMASTPRAADVGIDVLRALLQFGIHRGVLSRNVAAGIGKLYVNGQRAEIVWSEADLALFRAVAGEQDARVADAVDLAAVTGLRREDLARLTWNEVGEFAIVRRAAKASKGRRRFASIPRIPELDAVMERLRLVPRADGVDTLLVTAAGVPWELNLLSKYVGRIVRKAGIAHIDADTGKPKFKHLHDVRGTFATRLMTGPKLTNEEVAGIMGWSPNEVERIRRIYVDDTARSVALGRRIARKCKPEL